MEVKTINSKDIVFGQSSFDNHEQIVFCNDTKTGLKAIIGIHDTTLGPALGGTRMWNYKNEYEALNDVLRLSRGMTFKSAITGLDLGGGKAVIIGDAKTQKNDDLMRRFGEFVNSLGGKYITAEDVGMETHDMDVIREVTPHVVGVSESLGGSGNPSPLTSFGVYMGMKAAAKYKYGSDSLEGKKVLVQGVGHVGEALVKHITDEGAQVILNDINEERLQELSKKYNDETINKIKAQVIAGSANNQLADEIKHGQMLREKGIAYAPDFLINAGGIINVYAEVVGYGKEESFKRAENIYNTTLDIFNLSEKEDITTYKAAFNIAKKRIEERRKENSK